MMVLVSSGKAAKGVEAIDPGVCTICACWAKLLTSPAGASPLIAEVKAVWYSSRRNLRTRSTILLMTGSDKQRQLISFLPCDFRVSWLATFPARIAQPLAYMLDDLQERVK